MQRFSQIITAEFARQRTLLVAYPINIVTSQVLFTLVFFMLAGLSNLVTVGGFDRVAQAYFLVGYMTWYVSTSLLEEIVQTIADDAQWGTLEQVWLGGRPLFHILNARSIVLAAYFIVRMLLIAAIAIPLLGLQLIPSVTAGFLFILTLLSIVGIAYSLIGLQLIAKNVAFLVSALRLVLFFATGILSSTDSLPVLGTLSRFLPLTSGISLLRSSIIEGASIADVVNSAEFLFLSINTIFYLGIGLVILHWGIQQMRLRATSGHY